MITRQAFLFLLVTVLAVVSLFVGAADLTAAEVWNGLLGGLGRGDGDTLARGVVIDIRLPRVLAGIVLGIALGVAGVGLQGVLRNQLADPYLLGISSGAGLGLLAGTLMGRVGTTFLVPVVCAAAAGGIVAFLTRRWAGLAGFDDGLVLVGVAVNFVFLAWTLVITFAVDNPRLPTFAYFVFGSLSTVTWPALWVVTPVVLLGALAIAARARSLDLLSVGDDEATSLGIDVRRVSAFVLAAVGIAVGASVALAGVVGFVGLIAPLVGRRLLGAGHRALLPGAALIGAIFVLGSDMAIRGLIGRVEVPLGVVTAAIGGPVLVAMLVRRARS